MKRQSTNVMQNFAAWYGKWVRQTPPSLCYHASEVLPTGMFNVPVSDFDPKDVLQKKETNGTYTTFAPAYQGGFGFFNREDLFASNILTPCHYSCSKWAGGTPVGKLLELGMVVGGGLTLVLFADQVGYFCGNKVVTRDMKPDELASVIFGDVRILYHAIPKLVRCGAGQEPACRDLLRGAWWGVSKMTMKAIVAIIVVMIYRPYVLQFSKSFSDRGVMRCIIYVSLYNVFLRSIFVFTQKVWDEGEDSNFRASTSDGYHLKSYSLYEWLELPGRDVFELLFEYIYGIGARELESDDLLAVLTIEGLYEQDYIIQKHAKGRIMKSPGSGALFEGTKVKVEWDIGGVFENLNGERGDCVLNKVVIPVDARQLIEGDSAVDDKEKELESLLFPEGDYHVVGERSTELLLAESREIA